MYHEVQQQSFDVAQGEVEYLRRRVREEAEAGASAHCLASTLVHVVLASAYAKRCCDAADRAWVAEHRAW
jgi:hypothetical protein